MEWINKKIILLAIILSLFTSLFIYSYINRVTKTTKPTDLVKVYVAAKTIPSRAMISAADVKEIEIDKKYVLPGAYQNKAEIIGKRVKDPVLEGEQILKDRLADEAKMNLSYSIPEGKRAVSINVNEASVVANFIRPGDYVDIVGTFEKEDVTEADKKIVYPKITKVVLQNVMVLGIGQDNHIPEGESKKDIPKTVTLAIDTQDTEKLVYSSEVGVLRLALRPVGDTQNVQTGGVIRKEITGDKGAVIFPK